MGSMSHANGLRLAVADASPFRHELKRLLHSEPGLRIVAQCACAADAVRLAEQHRPDVLLLDLSVADGSAWDALRGLSGARQPVPTLGVSSKVENAVILEALNLGARGVIQKNSSKALLVECIRTVARNDYWVAPGQLRVIIDALRASRPLLDAPVDTQSATVQTRFRLTRRELEVVAGITTGESNKEIAERLAVAECTVKHHLASVFDKVGVFSRLQLALFAIHHHLVNVTEFLP
jgi:two-component system, NarL family, nitrate/nitrite response regulator NarL